MSHWEARMGKGFLDEQNRPILKIGNKTYSKRQMVEGLKCPNFAAAKKLDAVIRTFQPKNVRELAKRITIHDLFDFEGIGPVAVSVWLRVLEAHGIDPLSAIDERVNVPTSYAKAKKAKKTKRVKKFGRR